MLIDQFQRLSFSSIAKFKNAPAVWCIEYLYGVRGDMGPAAWRGSAVEAGVDLAVMKPDATNAECLDTAIANFQQNTGGEVSDAIVKEQEGIEPMLTLVIPFMRAKGMPVARQFRVEHWIDGLPLPLVGYVDYLYPEALIDLKTTLRMPSEAKPDHAMQVASYRVATKKAGSLVYVTPKKIAEYRVEETDDLIADLSRAGRALCHALAKFQSADDMTRCYAPDFNSFYWETATIEKAKEVWAA